MAQLLTYSIYRIHTSDHTSERVDFWQPIAVDPTLPVFAVLHQIIRLASLQHHQLATILNAAEVKKALYLPSSAALTRELIAKKEERQFNVIAETGRTLMDDTTALSEYLSRLIAPICPNVWVILEDNLSCGSDILPYIMFKSSKGSTFTSADLDENQVVLTAPERPPLGVLEFVADMSKKRKIGFKAYEALVAMESSPANLNEFLEAGGEYNTELGQNEASRKLEGSHYLNTLERMKSCQPVYLDGAREASMDSLFYHPIAITLQARTETEMEDHNKPYVKFSSQPWPHPFLLPCKTPQCGPDDYVKYPPLLNTCFWRGCQPLWLSVTFSEPGTDRLRLLFRGASLVKLYNSAGKSHQYPFILPVIYINKEFLAEVLYMYRIGRNVLYHRETYKLGLPEDALRFMVVVYNLGDRKALWSEYGFKRLESLKQLGYSGTLHSNGGEGTCEGDQGEGEADGGSGRKRPREGEGRSSSEPFSKRTAASGGGETQHLAVLSRQGFEGISLLSSESAGMSKVYRAQNKFGNCVIKVLAKTSPEIDFLRLCNELNAPNIIHYREIIPTEKWSYVVFPFLSVLGDAMMPGVITSKISSYLGRMSVDLARGIGFLHSHNIAHLDISSHNLVFDENMRLLVIDLGIAVQVTSEEDTMTGIWGSEYWMAPEIKRKEAFSPIRADRFSCGVVFHLMALWARPAAPGLEEFSLRLRDERPFERPALLEWVDRCAHSPLPQQRPLSL